MLLASAPYLPAQGGPPMITDDPGTPGNGRWEINIAWSEALSGGTHLAELPLVDANYGVGDRIQLNYQSSWNINEDPGGRASDGLAQTQLAVKWRYFDAGDQGLQLSTYPRVTFQNPGSDADRRGVTPPGSSVLVPLEAVKDLGAFSLDVDLGHTFSASSAMRGWMCGVCLGREVRKGLELDVEAHANTNEGLTASEIIVNFGGRVDLTEHTTLLVAVGRDTRDSLGPSTTLLTYLGIQVRL